MSGLTYTGVYPTMLTTISPQPSTAPGSTRWNTTTSKMEMWDGYQWQAVTAGEVHKVTLAEEVEHAEDRIVGMIESDYPDNATILDAFKSWQEANERFRVILALTETK